ncbi:MAG TPA: LuxR C-terminal-related transcriptional regulator [Solirubrobacteraceae bacterium]|jgi:DNA-binding CsgD family transcriptional regulator|nr:LuxR C-terminal-related transcriptional regulator [Solirubrobacteraceae bacterium]
MESRLSTSEQHGVSAVLEAADRARSMSEFLATTLAAFDEHLGYSTSAFMLTTSERPHPGHRAYAGVQHGHPSFVLEEYFERWADLDPLTSEPGLALFERRGYTTMAELYSGLDRGRRRFVDDFLRRTGAQGQLSVRLAAGWSDGYVTLHNGDGFDSHDRLLMNALAPQLTELLARRLPAGLEAGLTVREGQVAELVTLGFSNAEIAGILHVEEDTVKKHVSHAMAKVGVHRRTQLAVAWATGRRLDLPAPNRA